MSSSQDSYNPRNGDSDTISVNTTWTAMTSFHKDITRDDHSTDLGTRHARKSHGIASTTRALPVISLPTHLHSSEKRDKEKGKAVDRSHHSHSHTSSRRHHSTHDDSHTEANSSMHSHTETYPSTSPTTTSHTHTHTHANTPPPDIDVLRSQIDALKKELHESKKSTRKYFKKAEEARRELKDESASKELLKRDIDATKRQVDDAKRERDDAKKDMDMARCELEEMKAELKFIEDMKLEMEKQKKEVDQAQAEMDEVKKMVEDMKGKVEGAEKEKGERVRLSELMSTIEQSLQCQICLDMLYEPYTLSPCGHTLCLPCLQSWFRKAPSASDPDISDSSTSVSSFHSQSSAQSQDSLPLSISDASENEEEQGVLANPNANDHRPTSPTNPQLGESSTLIPPPRTGTDTRTWPTLPSAIPGPATTPLEPRPQARVSFSHLFSLGAQRQYLTTSNVNDRQARRAAALVRRREREERRRQAEERREERRRDREERRTAREERRTIRRRKTCPCCRTQITQRPVLARVVREIGERLRAGAPANPLMSLAAANPAGDAAKEDPWKGIFPSEPSQMNSGFRVTGQIYLSDSDSDDVSEEEEIGMGGAMGLFFDVEDDEEEEDEPYPFDDSDSNEDDHDHDRDNEEGPSANSNNNNNTRNRRNLTQDNHDDDDDDESDLYTEDEDDDDEEHRFFRYMSGEDGEPDDETNNHNATPNHEEEDGIVPFGQADSDSASNASSEDEHPAPSSRAESSAAVVGTGLRRGGPAGPRGARGRARGAGSGLLNLSFVPDLSRMMPRGIGRGRGAGRGQGQARGRRRRGARAGSTSGSRSQSRSGPPPLLTTQPQGVQTEEDQYQEPQTLRLQIPGSLPVNASHPRAVFPPLPASPPRGGTRVDGDEGEERGHVHSDQGEEQGPEAGPSNNRPLLSLNLTSPSPRSPSWFYTRWTRSVSLPSPWNAATSRLGVFGLGGRSGDVSEASVDGRDEHEHEHDRDRDGEEDDDGRSELGSLGHARELDISADEGSASGGSVVYRRIPRRTRNMSRVIESESEGEDVLTGMGPFGRRIVNGNGLTGRRRRVSEPITTSRTTYTTASGSGLGVPQIQVQDRPRFGGGAERRRRERMLERRREEWTGSELDNTDDDDDDQGRGYLSFEDSGNEGGGRDEDEDGRSDVAMVGERRFATMMRRRLS